MFRGATKVTLDDKGRMVMPTRYREQLTERAQGKLVVTVDRDQCLLLYPLPDWEEIERKLMSLPNLNPQARQAAAAHGGPCDRSRARRARADSSCRRSCANSRGSGAHGMLIGQGNRFELWDETRWNGRRDLWLQGR